MSAANDAFNNIFTTFDQSVRGASLGAQPHLDARTRALLALAMVAAKCQAPFIAEHVRQCVEQGWGRTEVAEALVQVYCYAGVYASLSGFQDARAAFDELERAGRLTPQQAAVTNLPAPDGTLPERQAAGVRMREQVFGTQNAQATTADRDPFMDVYWRFTQEFCFGNVWSRPALDARLRSQLCLAITAATGQFGAVSRHVRSALANGVSQACIGDILLLAYVYGGVHNAEGAFTAAQDEFQAVRDDQP